MDNAGLFGSIARDSCNHTCILLKTNSGRSSPFLLPWLYFRELGYVDGLTLNSYFFNNGLIPETEHYIEGIECDGSETSLLQCP